MATAAWHVTIEGEAHLIELHHGYWSGRRTVLLDGKVAFNSRKVFDAGSVDGFCFQGHTFVMRVRAHILTFSYDLFLDGRSVTTNEEFFVAGAKMHELAFEKELPIDECTWLEQQAQFWDTIRRAGFLVIMVGAPLLASGFSPVEQVVGGLMLMMGMAGVFQLFRDSE